MMTNENESNAVQVPRCTRCGRPAHATETNDDGVCVDCLGDAAEPPAEWFDTGPDEADPYPDTQYPSIPSDAPPADAAWCCDECGSRDEADMGAVATVAGRTYVRCRYCDGATWLATR